MRFLLQLCVFSNKSRELSPKKPLKWIRTILYKRAGIRGNYSAILRYIVFQVEIASPPFTSKLKFEKGSITDRSRHAQW
jgi:hypothetical protein